MRDVAIVAFAQSDCVRDAGARNEVELIMPVLQEVYKQTGINSAQDVDFTCSGSCDYQQGAAFAFVAGVDALGAVPPIKESHVEMDAAWALYESWLKIQMGQAESALIYGFGKSSPGELPIVLSQQLDPYYLAPLWVDTIAFAAMQARVMLEQGLITEAEMAEVVARSRKNAANNPHAQLKGDVSVDELLAEPEYESPLRRHDCCPISDGACAMIICTVEKAKEWGKPYAVIKGIDHRIETHHIGSRDLTQSISTKQAAEAAGVAQGPVDIAELYAPFSHQEIILRRALNLSDDTKVNPSGGVLAGNVMMASGLSRIGEVAMRLINGEGKRGVAHATSGPCLQQNLVTVLEAQ
ncbi:MULTISPECIES: thiolase domain-containing protein [Spongiibacter]|jgi:acetyl-CoA acetyltransferase|uniref:thiolase domain-containing protein n=2 Tax=Spongiibacteraceae TaxID=1706375 RepID=UPI0019612F5C|nr:MULTISPECIES: thiolase domain-containing protein [Spongiibacter]MBM7423221.1 acetyl-CoA acetyltransferase [Spongiibacter marinus]MEE2652983.1 thiolase domain-containing protein [Pseudomonadota bacterium]|tara:strand:- start:12961 stop:14019 length:1059 start_codon:yes stop_codon:yes gene_type:complete